MIMQVNQELCSGCGVCVEACSVEAVHLVDHRAVIDNELCTVCKACLYTCPNGAITALVEPVHATPAMALPAPESRIIRIPTQTELPQTTASAHGLMPLAGAALAFIGSEVVPRVLDLLATTLERRLARPAKDAVSTSSIPIGRLTAQRRGKQRQARYRGRQMSIRNLKERR